jgi:hypothetical protein
VNVDQEGAQVAPAHRITWFGVERPVEGTVFVKPPTTEAVGESTETVEHTD